MPPFRFKNSDMLIITDRKLRETAPKGRNVLKITNIRTDGWVDIQYEDGTHDSLTYSLLEKFWGFSPSEGTKLWKLLNERIH